MTNCNHQFIKVCSDHNKNYQDKNSTSQYQVEEKMYAIVVCAWCGHVRHVYANGDIKVIKDHGETTQSV